MAAYRKFSDTWRDSVAENTPKTLAGLATLAGGHQEILAKGELSGRSQDAQIHTPNPAKAAKVAKVCVQCNASDEPLWTVDTEAGLVLVHQECARLLPRPDPVEPSAAYQAVSAEPDGTACKVEIVELPQAARYRKVFGVLQLKPPAHIPEERWRQCVEDGKRFLAKWGEQAEALEWTSADLFGLAPVPERPHPSYNRLSRYDCTGLCWLLQGRDVIALTADGATIRRATGSTLTCYRHGRPALGPLGDSLDDSAKRRNGAPTKE